VSEEIMRLALELIDRDGCTTNTRGRCWDEGRQRGARYGADAWCDACVARDALGLEALEIPTQAQTLDWVKDLWPDKTDPSCRALKLGEEVGEVLGAVIKITEGRKTLVDLATETAQLVICAMALAESAGFDLRSAIAAEWERCGTRTCP
jgi:NTP pyrophosphatase (non-canonical NTP hydrolase)